MGADEMLLTQEIVNAISGLGFPVVVCFCLWKYVNTTMKEFTQMLRENTEMLKLIIKELERGGKNDD